MSPVELRALLGELERHAPGERLHGERVAVHSVATAHHLGMPEEELLQIRFAAALHDVGKLDLPADLLSRFGRISGADVLALRTHAALGAARFDGRFSEWIGAHHERWDGNGYPAGLVGEAIPVGARIIAVAETYDVLVNENRWRTPLNEDQALDEIQRCAGTQFDSEVVNAFLAVQSLIQPLNWE